MKKLFLLLFTSFMVFTSFQGVAYANTKETNTQYFDITMKRVGQSAWNKAVTYSISVTPKIDSPKTQILWDAPSLIDISPKHEEFVDLYIGQTYTFKATLKAKREGSYEVSVNLIAWQHDTNYTNSVSDIVTFDSNLLVQPLDPSYTFGNIAKILIIVLLSGLAIWGLVVLLKKGLKAFTKWLTPPN